MCLRVFLLLSLLWMESVSSVVQDLVITIGVVTEERDDLAKDAFYQEVRIYKPRSDVKFTAVVNWSCIDGGDPFASARYLLKSATCEVDLLIVSLDWARTEILLSSFRSRGGNILFWYGGVVRDIQHKEYLAEEQHSQSLLDCRLDQIRQLPSLSTSISKVQSSLLSDFVALKGQYMAVLSHVLTELSWNEFTLVTDATTANVLNDILVLFDDGRYKVTQLQVLKHTKDDDIFKRFQCAHDNSKHGGVHFLVICEITCLERVIKQANGFDDWMDGKTALAYMSRWLIVTLPDHRKTIEDSLGLLNNVAILSSVSKTTYGLQDLNIIIDTAITDVLTNSNLSRSEASTGANKAAYVNATVQSVVQIIKQGDRSHVCKSCPVFEIFTALWKSGGRMFNPVGVWSESGHLEVHSWGIYPNIHFGFNNQTLRTSTNLWPFFVRNNTKTGEFEGLCIDLLKELARKLNFSFQLQIPADKDWGVLSDDGHWTGLVGDLEFGRADLTVAPLAITADREEVADFAYPFYYDYNVVLIKKPEAYKTKWRTLLDIFTWPVYVGIALSLPFMTILLYLTERCNPFYRKFEEREMFPGLHNFQDCLWYMYGALLTQGGIFLPKSLTGRTILSFWWLYSTIMVASYSGNLIASLTVTKDRTPFDTLQEMTDQNEYIWGTTSGTYLNLLFQTSNRSDYRALWRGLERFRSEDPVITSTNSIDHINKVKAGGYAYINDKFGMAEWVTQECDLVFIKEEFFPMRYAIGLPNNSPFTDIFSEQMLLILESGLIQIWRQKWWPKQNFCSGPVKAIAKSVELIDVQSAFYLLFIGAVLGMLAVVAETIQKVQINRRRKHERQNVTTNNL